MVVVYFGSKPAEFLDRLLADRRNFRVDFADTEVRSIADPFWWAWIPNGFRKWPIRRRQRKRVTDVLVRLGIEHQGDIGDAAPHWPFDPQGIVGNDGVGTGNAPAPRTQTDDAAISSRNAQASSQVVAGGKPR